MKRIFRKILASVLPLSFLVTSFGCQDKGSNNAVENLEWFSVHAHEKVLRNKDYADKSDKTLDITLCKNEYEGTQLILAAKSDIESYDIEISPLVSGKAIFNGGVKVYNEKYMPLLHKKEHYVKEWKSDTAVLNYWQNRHRFNGYVTGSYKLGNFKFSLRERFQYTMWDKTKIRRKKDEWGENIKDENGNKIKVTTTLNIV